MRGTEYSQADGDDSDKEEPRQPAADARKDKENYYDKAANPLLTFRFDMEGIVKYIPLP